jgi:DNA-directed RNA polymerase specialized sigma24 family protein
MNSPKHKKHSRHSFDSYCKKILKRKTIDCHRETKRRGEREIPFSDLPKQKLDRLSVTDKYFANEYVFNILDENICVSNCELGDALSELPADRREIVMMSYFFDMTDKEVVSAPNILYRP